MSSFLTLQCASVLQSAPLAAERGPHPAASRNTLPLATRHRRHAASLLVGPSHAVALHPLRTVLPSPSAASCGRSRPRAVGCQAATYEDLEFYIDTGIYDIPQLTEPQSFWQLCDRTSAHVESELAAIAALPRGAGSTGIVSDGWLSGHQATRQCAILDHAASLCR
jgi:hypothetical protein